MKSKNKTRYLILGLLNESPMSGYDIKKIVDVRFVYFWSESFGQIYPELKKMKAEGVIREAGNQLDKTRRKTCKYEITETGVHEFSEWFSLPIEKEIVRFELLLKLYFSNHASADTMIDHIREFQMSHRKQQVLFESFERELRDNLGVHDNHSQILMVLLFGQKVWAAYDQWCQEVIDLFEKTKGMKESGL